ncbi:hypothetical protein RhiJN_22428 [Ceratobasidium sp. AG-Ba]|nr:hypothetical protein RhiJN_22428 [Ceratobasidium sp. AG-Ba]
MFTSRFIIESLGDLKPDPAERSVDALLAISQKLDVIITGQQTLNPLTHDPTLDTFTPSYSAIVVNILWLLSLSLSVAVSLIAMLAKEWCYKFMTSRSGTIYNQARRRQQNWDGIEKWKMQEILSYLPGLMHSALLGLCIYLWDIDVSVAIPVTVVTGIAGYSYAYYMVGYWPTQKHSKPDQALMLLVRTFLQNYTRHRDVAWVIASTLASAAFTVNWYPGGEQSSQSVQDRMKRALKVLRSYHTNPGEHIMGNAFTFGFAFLPYIDFNELQSYPQEESVLCNITRNSVYCQGEFPATIPTSYTWTAHLSAAAQNFEPQIIETLEIPDVWPGLITLYLLFSRAGFYPRDFLVPVLAILRYAKDQNLQEMCTKALMTAPISRSWSQISAILNILGGRDMLQALLDAPQAVDDYISATVVFHFRLLIGNVMLCEDNELIQRQSILRRILYYNERFQSLESASEDRTLPSREQILDHVAEDINGVPEFDCILWTMQLVFDFCNADPTKSWHTAPGPPRSDEEPEWVTELQVIKDNFKPNFNENKGLEVMTSGGQMRMMDRAAISQVDEGSVGGSV